MMQSVSICVHFADTHFSDPEFASLSASIPFNCCGILKLSTLIPESCWFGVFLPLVMMKFVRPTGK